MLRSQNNDPLHSFEKSVTTKETNSCHNAKDTSFNTQYCYEASDLRMLIQRLLIDPSISIELMSSRVK